jgi:2-keto-4-pentenoate hydratase/2-oxohepta-3-ene-1,7-dioic acid hydratase in catechol pathway
MRLATVVTQENSASFAAVLLENGKFLNIAKAASLSSESMHSALQTGKMQAIVDAGNQIVNDITALVSLADTESFSDACHDAEDCTVQAPIPTPRKNVFCVGRNYAEHIAEGDRAQNQKVGVTEHPVYFTKPSTAVVGPDAMIPIFPELSESIDYEVELAVVIGKSGRNIKKADAYDYIFGYSIANDITARDVQRRHGGQYFKGKALDGSCPFGPYIVTADQIDNPHNLGIRLSVNDEMRQDGNTQDMIFDIPTLIESLSQGLTLEPGDIIATGTPSGVGYAMEPPRFLKSGDVVVCEIDQIGTLRNTLRAV